MSEKYFWREKNADKFIGKYEVIKPTRSELINEISAKLAQKVEKIVYIFDKKQRNLFLSKANKPLDFDVTNKTEKEVQTILGENLIVDFLQLARDASKFFNLDFDNFSNTSNKHVTYKQIKKNLETSISNLLDSPKSSIQNIVTSALSLANILELNTNKIEELRVKKEQKQGNFFNGKYVIM